MKCSQAGAMAQILKPYENNRKSALAGRRRSYIFPNCKPPPATITRSFMAQERMTQERHPNITFMETREIH